MIKLSHNKNLTPMNYQDNQTVTDKPLNVIGQAYYKSDEIQKQRFIEVAENKAMQHGSMPKKFRRVFQETQAFVPLANVYTYFLHAAHEVYGLSFDFRVSARKNAQTGVITIDDKLIEISIENL
jgi:hypothetical protein